jgi:DNA-directed RNA polymerase subunit RPC12/RpoP
MKIPGRGRRQAMTDVRASGGIRCPRCGGPLAVGSNHHVAAQFGLVGALISLFLTKYVCTKCGTIPFGELPQEVRDSTRWGLWAGSLIVLVLLAGVIALLGYFSR